MKAYFIPPAQTGASDVNRIQRASGYRFLIDCGASSLVAMKRLGVSPSLIDTILISRLARRSFRRHSILAPRRARRDEARSAARLGRRFPIDFIELIERQERAVGFGDGCSFEVVHPSGSASYAQRIACQAR